MASKPFNITTFFIVILLGLVVIQVGSVILSSFMDVEMLSLGWAFILLIAIVSIISIFVTGRRLGQLDKKDIIFIIIQIVAIVVLFIYLPILVPEIFSSIPPAIKETFSSILP